jgi:hypothetical protein
MRLVLVVVVILPLYLGAQPVKSKGAGSTPHPAMHEADYAPAASTDASFMPETASGAYWLEHYTQKHNEFIAGDGIINKAENNSLNAIINQAAKTSSGSFEYHYMLCRQSRNTALASQHLRNALQIIGSSNVLLLAEEAWIAERKGDKKGLNAAITAYQAKGGISPAQLQVAQWTLEVVPKDALIITHGEFDTYGLWYAGNAQRHVVSMGMMEDRVWLQNKITNWDKSIVIPSSASSAASILAHLLAYSSKPVYLSLGIRPELLQPYAANLFPVGPVALYSSTSANLFNARRNLYLSADFNRKLNLLNRGDAFAPALSNLLPGALALKNESQRLSQSEVVSIEQLIRKISQISGKKIAHD